MNNEKGRGNKRKKKNACCSAFRSIVWKKKEEAAVRSAHLEPAIKKNYHKVPCSNCYEILRQAFTDNSAIFKCMWFGKAGLADTLRKSNNPEFKHGCR